MKSVSMSWVMSAVIAVCLTPTLCSFTRRAPAPHPEMLAQDDGSVAVPGSADAPAPNADDDDGYQSGQAQSNDQTQDDPDSAQQPPANMQQPPADDSGENGDDTSAQPQSGGDNGDQGEAPTSPSSGNDEN